MGTSTDAILLYGIQFGECVEGKFQSDDGEESLNCEDVICKAYGWDGKKPKDSFEYKDKHKVPVVMSIHCSYEYAMYTLAIEESVTRANCGHPVEIGRLRGGRGTTPDQLQVWDRTLKDACERLSLKYSQPAWWLQSMWG